MAMNPAAAAAGFIFARMKCRRECPACEERPGRVIKALLRSAARGNGLLVPVKEKPVFYDTDDDDVAVVRGGSRPHQQFYAAPLGAKACTRWLADATDVITFMSCQS
jgi:hypothetical protein